ncbi:hypothetical protein [Streptomyces sp. NPDC053427]|uniref:hypothetical protein n=1 Tax=Streptomyces sp. NPDC053427 TaxID=3365701 RepID=UPI0037D53075
MSTTLTSAERAALLREQLSGARSETRSARRLRQSPAVNVLIGATLHAAARRERGLELTELEELLAGKVESLFGPQMLAEFGRIYQEPASRSGAASLFPALIADRPWEEGFGAEDLCAFAPEIQKEVEGLPGVRQVAVEDLERGVLTGEEDVVVVTGAPTKGTEFEVDDIHEVRLKFVKFRCDRRSTELGKDEIYWASAGAGDSKAQIVMLTPEFDEIVTGSERDFASHAFWFKGAAEGFMAGHIQVWEADHSPSSHYAKVRQGLADIAQTFAYSALESGPTWDAVFLGMVAAAAGLVNWILSLNKDDFIKESTFAYTRDALARMAGTNGGRSQLVFDGGGQGKHTLTIEVSFGPVIASNLRHSLYYNGKWSTPVHVPQLMSATVPSMVTLTQPAMHETRTPSGLYAFFKDAGDVVQFTRYDGEAWTAPITVRDSDNREVRSKYDVGVVAHRQFDSAEIPPTLILGWTDHSSSTATRFDAVNPETGRLGTSYGRVSSFSQQPSMVSHKGNLYLFRSMYDWGELVVSVYDPGPAAPNGWAPGRNHPMQLAPDTPRVIVYQDRIWVFAKDRQNPSRCRVASSSDLYLHQWRDEPTLSVVQAERVPAVAAAHFGAYEDSEERLAFTNYAQGGFVTWMTRNGEGMTLAALRKEDSVRRGMATAFHLGTLHLLFW